MMLSALGLPQNRNGVYGDVQRYLQANTLGVYMPQLLTGESANIGLEYNALTGGLSWKAATLMLLRNLDAPMVFHYSSYWYASKPMVLGWTTPTGWHTQEDLSAAEMAVYLRSTHDWLVSQGIRNAWVMVDEPPHQARYGLTPEIESRVIKFVNACSQSGFGVAVCTPNPSHYDFWRQRILPSWWILFDRGDWPNMPGCWLYNAQSYAGLAGRMKKLGAVGYLQWSAVTSTVNSGQTPILCQVNGDTYTPTEHVAVLLRELADTKPPTVEERLANLEHRVTVLEAK